MVPSPPQNVVSVSGSTILYGYGNAIASGSNPSRIISVPVQDDFGPRYASQALASLSSRLLDQLPLDQRQNHHRTAENDGMLITFESDPGRLEPLAQGQDPKAGRRRRRRRRSQEEADDAVARSVPNRYGSVLISSHTLGNVMDTEGKFNGSCTSADANPISPEVPSGSCASYFPDVTRYCCAAVGGSYNDTNTAVEDMSLNASALNHPTCVTTSYRDMLSCYRFVTETYCSSQNVSPYGVCSQAGQDTSNSAGEAARRPTAKTWIATVGLFGVAVCLGTLWS